MEARKTVAVLMGGRSSEHDVSLNSGKGVARALDRDRYVVLPITIRQDGAWQFPDCAPVDVFEAVPRLQALGIDCVFIALHGPFGEDGRMQGLLDTLGLPYTGTGCAGSALAMDKARAKAVVSGRGIPVADQVILDARAWRELRGRFPATVAEELGFPCVVKPVCLGSSVGIEIVQDAPALEQSVASAFAVDEEVMVEAFVDGVEVTCAVLDVTPGERARALPVTEIRPKNAAFFDYTAKYTAGATEEITPAEIDATLTKQVQDMAVRVHEVIGCATWSRSDFIIGADGPVWIEVNTVPGLTETSLYPQAAAAAGISYSEMVGMFVEAALRRERR